MAEAPPPPLCYSSQQEAHICEVMHGITGTTAKARDVADMQRHDKRKCEQMTQGVQGRSKGKDADGQASDSHT